MRGYNPANHGMSENRNIPFVGFVSANHHYFISNSTSGAGPPAVSNNYSNAESMRPKLENAATSNPVTTQPTFGSSKSGPRFEYSTKSSSATSFASADTSLHGETTSRPSSPSVHVCVDSGYKSSSGELRQGRKVAIYTPTPAPSEGKSSAYFSISAMPIFGSKSHEELRSEYYKRQDGRSQNQTAPFGEFTSAAQSSNSNGPPGVVPPGQSTFPAFRSVSLNDNTSVFSGSNPFDIPYTRPPHPAFKFPNPFALPPPPPGFDFSSTPLYCFSNIPFSQTPKPFCQHCGDQSFHYCPSKGKRQVAWNPLVNEPSPFGQPMLKLPVLMIPVATVTTASFCP